MKETADQKETHNLEIQRRKKNGSSDKVINFFK